MSPNFERELKDEIWGCFKYIGIPMDTLLKMPVRDRKFYILKHNESVNKTSGSYNDSNSRMYYDGDSINAAASLSQKSQKSRS